VRAPCRRAVLHAYLQLLGQPDRVPVRSAARVRAQQLRPPKPSRRGEEDPRLPAVAQRQRETPRRPLRPAHGAGSHPFGTPAPLGTARRTRLCEISTRLVPRAQFPFHHPYRDPRAPPRRLGSWLTPPLPGQRRGNLCGQGTSPGPPCPLKRLQTIAGPEVSVKAGEPARCPRCGRGDIGRRPGARPRATGARSVSDPSSRVDARRRARGQEGGGGTRGHGTRGHGGGAGARRRRPERAVTSSSPGRP